MIRTPLCDQLGISIPLFAFSKAKEVVAEVSKAGGLGVLGAVAYTTAQLSDILDWLDVHTDGKPYGVDVVMPASLAQHAAEGKMTSWEGMIPEGHRAFVDDLLNRYQVPPLPEGQHAWHDLLAWTEEATRPQVEVALRHPIRLLANALGPPPRDIVEQAHRRGMLVAALTGSVKHARKHVENGVDIIVAQGTEAGGHCGEISTMVLVPEVVDAVSPVPVLAAGGIGNGRQMAAALALGAAGAWTGSIWLTAAESDVPSVLQDKLLAASSEDTVRSRALTGKPARQLRTAWSDEWSNPHHPPLPMPLQFMLTAEATSRIFGAAGRGEGRARELLTSPVGQIVGQMKEVRPVREIISRLLQEYDEAVERLAGRGR